ncbi:MAG: electron transfer flavoprotein subunit beta/FixA family protein [Clostridia bacterium]|jgi:electron transfer flavoprotein beta subunit|nr:electron transfer flavoprotein subunit beta/FixA family protein [Clostridia bacterium]MCI2000077.1 electron transfer flavoprotein subunit beta/FixA family protein [Clostridia bacterium]MCI2014389.1 electron transfer flavoprotein subunit beta/FixA family protein [Clostridia bacterium]
MKIVVCIKQVPDTVDVKIDPKTGNLIREGLPVIINPDDKVGIEAALSIKEQIGGTVTVISMGPPQADVALREALAMGCDEAILVSGREFGGSDTYATSGILAAAIKKFGHFDLLITGRQAIDGDTAQVGPQLGEKLHIPQVSYVEEIKEVAEDHLIVKRQFEDGYHIIKIKTPCLLTAIGELAKPRYMTVDGVMDAYDKEVKIYGFDDLKDDLELDMIGTKGSPTNVYQSFPKQLKAPGTVLKDMTDDEYVNAIMTKLEEKHVI